MHKGIHLLDQSLFSVLSLQLLLLTTHFNCIHALLYFIWLTTQLLCNYSNHLSLFIWFVFYFNFNLFLTKLILLINTLSTQRHFLLFNIWPLSVLAFSEAILISLDSHIFWLFTLLFNVRFVLLFIFKIVSMFWLKLELRNLGTSFWTIRLLLEFGSRSFRNLS